MTTLSSKVGPPYYVAKMAAWFQIAWDNVEKHLGDVCCEGNETPEEIYEEAYTLAVDALHDAGLGGDDVGLIADDVARQVSGTTEEGGSDDDDSG